MTAADLPFPAAPYRIIETKSFRGLGGRRSSTELGALTALRRYMRANPETDPVVLDAADRPVSANTLFRVSVLRSQDKARVA